MIREENIFEEIYRRGIYGREDAFDLLLNGFSFSLFERTLFDETAWRGGDKLIKSIEAIFSR